MIYSSLFISIAIIAVFMTCMFFLSLIKKDNSIVDTAYGIGFILIALGTYLFFQPSHIVAVVLTTCVCLWASRLSSRIWLRNSGQPEDFRYKKWRDTWKYFKTRSFFQIYVLQGAIIVAISSPIIFVNSAIGFLRISPAMYWFLGIGLCVWLVGFFFEAVGDYQLDKFIANKKAQKASGKEIKKNIMDKGLWSLTRHPNYFGEVSMWWGLWIMSITLIYAGSGTSSVNWGALVAIISPITITFLLLKISGIPMLEEKYKGDKEFEAYKRKVNAFFPYPRSNK